MKLEKFSIYKEKLFGNDEKEFIGTIKFEENYLVSNSNLDIKGLAVFEKEIQYIWIFESEKQEFRTIFQKSKVTKSICLEININFENKLMGFNLLNNNKYFKEKGKKLQFFVKINNYSTISTNNFETEDKPNNNFEDSSEFIEREGEDKGENIKNQPVEEQSFLKKYFWYIVVGVIFYFQVKNFDTSKFKEKFEEAKAMQEARLNQNQNKK